MCHMYSCSSRTFLHSKPDLRPSFLLRGIFVLAMLTGIKVTGADHMPGSDALPLNKGVDEGYGVLDSDFSSSRVALVFMEKRREAEEVKNAWIWRCMSCISLMWKRIFRSFSILDAAVVVDKEKGRSREMETTDGVRAHHRWCFRQGYGTHDWQPAFLTTPSILLAERRPWLFLPVSMPKGR